MKSRSHLTFGLFSFQFDSTHYPAVFSAFHVLLKLQDSDQDFIASFAKVGFVDGDSGFRHRQRFDGRFFPGQTTLDDVFGNVVNIFFPLSAVACIQSVYGRNLLKKKKTNMSSRFRLFLLRGEGSLPWPTRCRVFEPVCWRFEVIYFVPTCTAFSRIASSLISANQFLPWAICRLFRTLEFLCPKISNLWIP